MAAADAVQVRVLWAASGHINGVEAAVPDSQAVYPSGAKSLLDIRPRQLFDQAR